MATRTKNTVRRFDTAGRVEVIYLRAFLNFSVREPVYPSSCIQTELDFSYYIIAYLRELVAADHTNDAGCTLA